MASKTAAIAVVNGSYGPETVTITKQRLDRYTMYAPGWRQMAFSTLDRAEKKLLKHPGFKYWVESSGLNHKD